MYRSTFFLTLALAGGEWSASHPGHFTPGERAHGTYWIGGWVSLRAGLDSVEKREFLTLPGLKSNPSVVQPVASHCTEYTILAPLEFLRYFGLKSWKSHRIWFVLQSVQGIFNCVIIWILNQTSLPCCMYCDTLLLRQAVLLLRLQVQINKWFFCAFHKRTCYQRLSVDCQKSNKERKHTVLH
jgi:hypothetical protein